MDTGLFIFRDRDGKHISNVAALIEQRALRQPAAPALIMKETIIGYRSLHVAVNAVATRLLDSGIKAGQMIGISMAQTPMHVFTLLALARIGVPFISVHPALPLDQRMTTARRYGVTAIVSGRSDFALLGLPFVLLSTTDLQSDLPAVPYAPTTDNTPLRIALSSDTSGAPGDVMLSHGAMRPRLRLSSYAMTPKARLLATDLNFPVSFDHALSALAMGAAVVLAGNDTPGSYIDAVRRFAVTDWMLSPALAERIAAYLGDDDIHFGTLTHLRVGGAYPSARLIETMFARFSPNLHIAYGMNEMGLLAMAPPEMIKRYPGSVGSLLPGIEGQVVDDNDAPLPVGQSGSLRLRTRVMLGSHYPDNGLATERFRNGWYYPRDMAHFNEDGMLFIEEPARCCSGLDGRSAA